jgi:hypothetical protein
MNMDLASDFRCITGAADGQSLENKGELFEEPVKYSKQSSSAK